MSSEAYYYRSPSSLYTLQSHPSYWFHVGRAETKQAIMGLLGRMFCVVLFDKKGDLIETQEQPLVIPSIQYPDELTILHKSVASEVERVRKEHGLTDQEIYLKRFKLPKLPAGIDDLPDELQEYVAKRDTFNSREEDLEEALEGWKEESLFVFWWGQSFSVDDEGMVVSS